MMSSTYTTTVPPNVSYRLTLRHRDSQDPLRPSDYQKILKSLIVILREFKSDIDAKQNADVISLRLHKWADKVFQLNLKDRKSFDSGCDALIKKLMFKVLYNFASPPGCPQTIQEPFLNGEYLWEKKVLVQYLDFATISPFDGIILNVDPQKGPVTLVWHEFAYQIIQWANQYFIIQSDETNLMPSSGPNRPLTNHDISSRAHLFVRLKLEKAAQKTMLKFQEGMKTLATEYEKQSAAREAEHKKQKEEFEQEVKRKASEMHQEFKQKLDEQSEANKQNKEQLQKERAKNEFLQRQILEQEARIHYNEMQIAALSAQLARIEANSGGGCAIL